MIVDELLEKLKTHSLFCALLLEMGGGTIARLDGSSINYHHLWTKPSLRSF